MKLSFLPLLQIQRDLYAMPRGMDRFNEYIKTMTDPETGELALPLVAMNPMGKEHVPALIDQYLALDAEGIAAAAVEAAAAHTPEGDREYRVGLVVSDDLKGGWTNRWASEFGHRIEAAAIHQTRLHHGSVVDQRAGLGAERPRRGADLDLSRGVPAIASGAGNAARHARSRGLRHGAGRLHDTGARRR